MILGLLKHKRWSTVDHSPWVLYRRAHIIFDFWLRDIRVWKLITFNPIWWDLEVWTFIAHYVSASNWAKVIVRLRKHILNFESEPLMWRNLKPMFKFQCFLTRQERSCVTLYINRIVDHLLCFKRSKFI